jgi:hypothetical protein
MSDFFVKSYWSNLRTGQTDYRFPPQAAEEWADYIPQSVAAQGLFKALLATGWKPNAAAVHVLTLVVGKCQ